MSNLVSAKDSLHAELEHARQGLEFYNSRVSILEETLAKLEALDGELKEVRRQTGRIKGKEKTRMKSAGGRQQKAGGSELPATGKEFWTSLINNEPKTSKEILDAAVQSLGISPSKDALKKLSQRQANALHMLVKEKAVSDSGSGRQRRFYRPV